VVKVSVQLSKEKKVQDKRKRYPVPSNVNVSKGAGKNRGVDEAFIFAHINIDGCYTGTRGSQSKAGSAAEPRSFFSALVRGSPVGSDFGSTVDAKYLNAATARF
jgi:hypothetical protein